MQDVNLYADGNVLPLLDGTIRLQRIKTRDDKQIRVYRKRSQTGEQLLCMATGIENAPERYRMAVTAWLKEYARAKLHQKVLFFSAQMGVTVNRIAIKEQKTR